METYKDLLDRKPKTPATVTIDGVEAALDYELAEQWGIITARYTEYYTPAELSWLQPNETIDLTGQRDYRKNGDTESVSSEIEMIFRTGKQYTSTDTITRYYKGESRRIALKQMEAIINAYRAAIDAIGNAANPDFEAELDAAVRESVTGGEAD